MKSFKSVYRSSKETSRSDAAALYEQQRVELVTAIKRFYAVNDFAALDESERESYRNMVKEMWSPKTGINEAGVRFINEGKRSLCKESSPEQIKATFQREVKANLDTIMGSVVLGENGASDLKKIKEGLESQICRKISASDVHSWTFEVLCKALARKVNSLKF